VKTLVTTGGQFHAHHFRSEDVPKELHIFIGRVRSMGIPSGCWLIYTREEAQGAQNDIQYYTYDRIMQRMDEYKRPQDMSDFVRHYH